MVSFMPLSPPHSPPNSASASSGFPPGFSLRLTDRQQQVRDWIRRHLESTGMPPTRAEIATGLGFSTASSAEDHLRALARKGALELTAGASRGLRLKDMPELPGMRWPPGSSRGPQGLPSGLLLGLPVVGRVA